PSSGFAPLRGPAGPPPGRPFRPPPPSPGLGPRRLAVQPPRARVPSSLIRGLFVGMSTRNRVPSILPRSPPASSGPRFPLGAGPPSPFLLRPPQGPSSALVGGLPGGLPPPSEPPPFPSLGPRGRAGPSPIPSSRPRAPSRGSRIVGPSSRAAPGPSLALP